jgi:release factor glutamine methyltransferase
MAHILGRREFWSLDFAVTSDTLTPRPDSETLVAAVLDIVAGRDRPLGILDLGTGTGCLLLALLHELPNATGVGVDRSAAALAVALGNAQALGLAPRVQFHEGDWGEGLTGRFDVVISNPPYIVSADVPNLSPEVRHEPRLALDGGADGLDAYRALAPHVGRLLEPAGVAVLEIGEGQAPAVEEILRTAGLKPVDRRRDLAGIERCIVARSAPYEG